MRVLVTGGAGFIGSHLVDRLTARGDDVVVLDNFDDGYDPVIKERNLAGTSARVVRADLREGDTLASVLDGVEAVVHLAARAGVRQSLVDPLMYEAVNVRGTLQLLQAMRRLPGVPLVFASSSSVYGSRPTGPFFEDDPADRPVSPYAATKRAGELLCHAAHAAWGASVTCLRFFTVYGPRQRPGMAIQHFVECASAGRPIPVFGDGSGVRDYTWVGDAVEAIVAALARPQPYAVINVGSGAPVRLDEMVAVIGRVVGRPVLIEHLPEQDGDVPRTHAVIERAHTLLGWSPTMDFAEGVARYVAWVRRSAGSPS